MASIQKELGLIAQFRTALSNPVAAIFGLLKGGIIPLATFFVVHEEIPAFEWVYAHLILASIGGLVFSAKTVFQWMRITFRGDAWKAVGFVVLAEIFMLFSHQTWLSYTMLAYLVVINAIATACNVAQDDAKSPKRKPTAKRPKAIAANDTRVPRTRKAA
jgi:hypothetical protein